MNHSGASLGDFFRDHQARGAPLVLATVVRTLGSTYRKAGAQMLIAADASAAGLLSGGCLEADLMDRAHAVLDTGQALAVDYDTRSSDDVLWGIGLGCEGAMTILMTRIDRGNQYQPFAFIEQCQRRHVEGRFALVMQSDDAAFPLGASYCSGVPARLPAAVAQALAVPPSREGVTARLSVTVVADNATFLVVPVELPPRLLVLGAGPDALPLVEIAGLMNWQVTVLDHRPAYAVAERFPRAARVALSPANALHEQLRAQSFDAAVVMSHHLLSDQAYLETLAASAIPYVGLLGPAPRRARLLSELGDRAAALAGRLHGPVGLDIGARTPETIALAIVSEILAVLNGRSGGSFAQPQVTPWRAASVDAG
jgi:xanthine/CO dehydrogenase XdhC/CoxF family maturation factor